MKHAPGISLEIFNGLGWELPYHPDLATSDLRNGFRGIKTDAFFGDLDTDHFSKGTNMLNLFKLSSTEPMLKKYYLKRLHTMLGPVLIEQISLMIIQKPAKPIGLSLNF